MMKRNLLILVFLSLIFFYCAENGEDTGSDSQVADVGKLPKDSMYDEDINTLDSILAGDTGNDAVLEDMQNDVRDTGPGDISQEDYSDAYEDIVLKDEMYIADDAATLDGVGDTSILDVVVGDDVISDAGSIDTGNGDVGIIDTGSDFILPPIISCNNLQDPCNLPPVENKIYATYRKDYYLNDSDYNEYTDYPVDGGRFHIAMVSSVSGKIKNIYIDGENVESMLVKPKMEWYHYWPESVKAGEIVWFAFHSKDKKWDSTSTGSIKIETDNGVAVEGVFDIKKAKVPLTYITTTDDYGEFLIFLRNTDSVTHYVKGIKLNGREVYTNAIACLPDRAIKSNTTAMIRVPLCSKVKAGDPYTVIVEFESAPPSVGVGRVIKPFFPIEAWPNSSECPVPGGNQTNYQKVVASGIDTVYTYMDNNKCNLDWFNLVNNVLPTIGSFYLLISDGFSSMQNAQYLLTNTGYVAGFLTGDESDGEVWDENNIPNASKKAKESQKLWGWYPDVPTYNGAKTNGNVGAFAGMADVQGIDFYVAACAPHITSWGKHPPLRGSYDYLLNTRNNHMPLPTWMYAQGLSPVWNKSDGKIHVQPDPQEIVVQGYSVMAAGGKGLMWFQINQDEANYKPERWAAISEVSRVFNALRKYLRAGDISGSVQWNGELISDVIFSREVLIVPVIGLKTTKAPTDISCGTALISEAMVPHWVLADQTVSIEVEVPEDFGVYEIFEIASGGISDKPVGYKMNKRRITIENINLSNSVPARIFVFSSKPEIRLEVETQLK